MGVSWIVKAQLSPAADPDAITAEIQELLNRLVLQMSTWEPDSDLSRFNRSLPGGWTDLPPEFFEVIGAALAWAERTNGAFDPTLGRLVDLWGFGPDRERSGVPEPLKVAAASREAGWPRLTLDAEDCRLQQPGGLTLDLSGIAKGYAVDAVSDLLHALDAPDHLVEIGGELAGSGVKPDGEPWWVALETPPELAIQKPPIVAALHGLAVATSGDYRQFRTEGERTISHTLDGRTGQPVRTEVRSVTVIAKRAMDADALATALLVMGLPAARAFADENAIAARFLVSTPGGHTDEVLTEAMQALL